MRYRKAFILLAAIVWVPLALAQTPISTPPTADPQPAEAAEHAAAPVNSTAQPVNVVPEPVDKRILGVLPNYRTANPTAVYEPLTPKQKLMIAVKDSFDWPSYLTAAPFSLLSQVRNDDPSFGQGVKGYARRYGTAAADQVDGNLLTEGLMPILLREDPRYFRRGAGNGKFWNRFWYASTRTLVTVTDSGGKRINISELLGNGIDAAIGNAYYPDERGFGDTMQRMWTFIGHRYDFERSKRVLAGHQAPLPQEQG